MIVVTGSNGLIGKALVNRLRQLKEKVITIDNGADVEINDLFRWLSSNQEDADFIFHLGANTNTLEADTEVFKKYNYAYSESLWYKCARHKTPLIYASSAATYGAGERGYSDSLLPKELTPLNAYGHSKNDFDKFVLAHNHINDAPFWAGLKFFNVYGYDESHKGAMASMVYQAYNQVKEKGVIRLFKSGEQKRDFIYVEDVVDCLLWMMRHKPESGIYNVGTGQARSFYSLANAVFAGMGKEMGPHIEYFDMPDNVKNNYQEFTEADISKLRNAGYSNPFISLEEGVTKYIQKLENGR